jgi:hypothetical protein
VRHGCTVVLMPMPKPGDACPGFMAEPGRCWRLMYSQQLQSTHCAGRPTWTGRYFTPKGDRRFRVWACPKHLEGLTGLREFGRRLPPGALTAPLHSHYIGRPESAVPPESRGRAGVLHE